MFGNNLGLDRRSNLFIEGVPAQQTHLCTHLRDGSFLFPLTVDMTDSDAPVH